VGTCISVTVAVRVGVAICAKLTAITCTRDCPWARIKTIKLGTATTCVTSSVSSILGPVSGLRNGPGHVFGSFDCGDSTDELKPIIGAALFVKIPHWCWGGCWALIGLSTDFLPGWRQWSWKVPVRYNYSRTQKYWLLKGNWAKLWLANGRENSAASKAEKIRGKAEDWCAPVSIWPASIPR
jgi:hypothetical protein